MMSQIGSRSAAISAARLRMALAILALPGAAAAHGRPAGVSAAVLPVGTPQSLIPYRPQRRHVRKWPFCDINDGCARVRFRREKRTPLLVLSSSGCDPGCVKTY